MHTATTNRSMHNYFKSYDDTETVARLKKEDAGMHQRPYNWLQTVALKLVGLVLARQMI
jgi:hypothetical protein